MAKNLVCFLQSSLQMHRFTFLILICSSLMAWSKPAPNVFRMSALTKLIDDNHIRSIEALVPALPQELLENFVLMKSSQSLQEATPENPRAILFGSTGRLILSFNGHKEQKNGDKLEVLEHDDSGAFAKTVLYEIDFSGESPHVSLPNPAKCLLCHGDVPKPLWGSYDEVKGAFGPVVKAFKTSSQNPEENGSEFMAFKKKAIQNPRYKPLFKNHEEDLYPFVADTQKPTIRDLPNARFAIFLSIHLAKQQAGRVFQDPIFQLFPVTSVATQYCTIPQSTAQDFTSILGQYLQANSLQRPLPKIIDYKQAADRRTVVSEKIVISEPEKDDFIAFDPPQIRSLLNLRSDELTLDIPYSTTALSSQSGLFQSTANLFKIELIELLKAHDHLDDQMKARFYLSKRYQETTDFFNDSDMIKYIVDSRIIGDDLFPNKEQCAIWVAKSVEEVTRAKINWSKQNLTRLANHPAPLARILSGPEILQTRGCIACHDSPGPIQIGPAIPFNNPAQLRSEIASDTTLIQRVTTRISSVTPLSHRMPMGKPKLTEAEQTSLVNYLKSFEN